MASKIAAALAFSATVASSARVKRSESTIAGVPVQNDRADADRFILLFEEGTTELAMSAFCGGHCQLVGHPDAGGAAFAAVNGRSRLEQMLKSRSGINVQLLEPDEMDYMIPIIESDPNELSSAQTTAMWGLDAVGVPERPKRGSGVHIYVQDTGVRTSHRDFGTRASSAMDVTSGAMVVCDGDLACARDRQGHGTHCAGTAGGSSYGVADQANIYAVKTLSDQGSGPRSWQYQGIDWVSANGRRPAVLSMSLGGSGVDQAYPAVLKAATDNGVVVVVAAGNSNDDACRFSPAFAPEVITVGATDRFNMRASYSNYGSCVNIMAPGSSIMSAWSNSDTASRSIDGTSMACPHVSGGAALLLEENPGLSHAEVRAALLDAAAVGTIRDLRGSAQEFLWVGASSAPTAAPTPAPTGCDPATTRGVPDDDGDCRCNSGLSCYENGSLGCTFSMTPSNGRMSNVFHSNTCGACECRRR